MGYNFSTLSDRDLEELVCDLLTVKFGMDFQSFKAGSDQGIDLRYATNNEENEVVVQVKHYLDSGLVKLKSILKKEEAEKVRKLNPKRYVFVTSLPLSPKNKSDIIAIFSPYISSSADVLGRNDLNKLLRANPPILQRHFKLWFSDIAVFQRVLHNGIKGRSEFSEGQIYKRIKIFVPSSNHTQAVNLLNQNNFILITGAPGIGKTTLANFLTYQFMAEGFELIYIRNVNEAETLYVNNKRQIFYFDDFLGSITLKLRQSEDTDSAIALFVERVKADRTKRLIMTCRTTILNQAKQESEIIKNSKIGISKHEVQVDNYRNIDKARILYNHVYFSNLSDSLKSIFFINQFHWKVIKHKNYNPRIVEFFTDVDRLQPEIDYGSEVIGFLNDPSKIWEKSFLKQISDEARMFLGVLFSLKDSYFAEEGRMKEAFLARLDYEATHSNYRRGSNTFNSVVEELVGGFVNRSQRMVSKFERFDYTFFNPSIEDFLNDYFNKNIEEYLRILGASIHIRQFKSRISVGPDSQKKTIDFSDKNDYNHLLTVFLAKIPELRSSLTYKSLEVVSVAIKLFHWRDVKNLVIDLMNELDIRALSWGERDELIAVLDYIAENKIQLEFSFSFQDILLRISADMTYYYEMESFSKLLAKHDLYKDIVSRSMEVDNEFGTKIQTEYDKSWSRCYGHFISLTHNLGKLLTIEELKAAIDIRKSEAKELTRQMLFNISPTIDNLNFDLQAQLSKNLATLQENEGQIANIQYDDYRDAESIEINRLFNTESYKEWTDDPF
jgi:energy-coupling factor transporter ATP-binding protein EcfA2